MSEKTVIFDFDGVWSADHKLFGNIASIFHICGYRTLMITGRRDWTDDIERMRESFPDYLEIHFSGGAPKLEVAQRLGITKAIWIDDDPSSITPPIIIDDSKL